MPHFRAAVLRDLGGWDAWNVTEDADLGLRLARFGYRTAVLDSTTSEEAPALWSIWMKQRRRWTKGWMQVTLVLLRDPAAWRDLGVARSVAVAFMLVNLVLGPLATPPVLVVAAWQAAFGDLARLSPLFLLPAAAIAATLWCGVAGARARRLGALVPWVPLLLPYQLFVAVAAWGGLLDLVVDPYGWRKTPHGDAALNRSSPEAPPRRRKACPRGKPGSGRPEPGRA